jgi:hypothetical protein
MVVIVGQKIAPHVIQNFVKKLNVYSAVTQYLSTKWQMTAFVKTVNSKEYNVVKYAENMSQPSLCIMVT